METSWTKTDKANIAVGIVTVAIAAAFWLQRAYTSEHGGTFADPVILVFGGLGAVLLVLGVLRRTVGRGTEAEDHPPIFGLLRAGLLLVAWIGSIPYLGYVLSSVLFFTLTALSMRTEKPRFRAILIDLVVAVVVVAVVYLIFTQVLYVRLPSPAF